MPPAPPAWPWLDELPAAPTLAWARLYEYVRRHGRPSGVIKDVGADAWTERLNPPHGLSFTAEQFAEAVTAAGANGALQFREDGKLEIPELMTAISPSTRRVRRHRRRHGGGTVAEGQPWWTIRDARAIACCMVDSTRPPVALPQAILEAADLLFSELRDRDPIKTLREWANVYAEKHAGREAAPSPVDWLSRAVSDQVDRDVVLAEQRAAR